MQTSQKSFAQKNSSAMNQSKTGNKSLAKVAKVDTATSPVRFQQPSQSKEKINDSKLAQNRFIEDQLEQMQPSMQQTTSKKRTFAQMTKPAEVLFNSQAPLQRDEEMRSVTQSPAVEPNMSKKSDKVLKPDMSRGIFKYPVA